MKRIGIALILLTLFMFSLTGIGCASSNTTTQQEESAATETDSEAYPYKNFEELDESELDNIYDIDQASAVGGLYISTNNGNDYVKIDPVDSVSTFEFYSGKEYSSNEKVSMWTGYSSNYPELFPNNSVSTELSAVNLDSGDKLVLFGDPSFNKAGVHPVIEKGFWLGESIDITLLDEVNGIELVDTPVGIEFVDAVEKSGFTLINRDDINASFEKRLYMGEALIGSSSENTPFRWGQYQGTHFAEGVFYTDTPYWITLTKNSNLYGDNGEDASYIRTKNGYFEIDLTAFASGTYVIETWAEDPSAYIIELVK